MIKKLVSFIFMVCLLFPVRGQDPRERHYNYCVLKPDHADKPVVEGWAESRVTESWNRGLTAVKTREGVYLSWRLLKNDRENTGFNVYQVSDHRVPEKLNRKPVLLTTDMLVPASREAGRLSYFVRPVCDGREGDPSEQIMLPEGRKNYLKTIRFQGKYIPDRVAVGDLNGDGEPDYVIKQPGGCVDPGVWRKSPDTFKLEAYLSDGTFLWRKDLGWNIELGIWYSPFIVYDFNGDGRAEVAVKTAPAGPDYRNEQGRVFTGPEYCSVLDGLSGEEIDRVDWPERGPRLGKYNRNNRNQMGMAYLDGKTPCLLLARGTYRLMMVDAYQLKGDSLQKLWRWDGDEENPVIRSQGAHSLHTVDLDEDGRDEIVLGSAVLDDNGTLLYSAGVGHSDKCFVTDIDPNRPGMEIFFANEVWHDSLGVSMIDARTGEPVWNIGHYTRHVGNGMVADILPEEAGLECFAAEDSKAGLSDRYMLSANGRRLTSNEAVPQCTNWVFWDADRLRESVEILAGPEGRSFPLSRDFSVVKYRGDTLQESIQGRIMLIADLYGDWREELVTAVPGELRVYATTIPATDRRLSLLCDPLYRSDVVHRSMGYPQAPLTGYYLGEYPSAAPDLAAAGYQERKEAFGRLDRLEWKTVMEDSGTEDWTEQWFLDGLKARVSNSPRGMLFEAGPVPLSDADHAVLWTKKEFQGDIRVEYDFVRTDTVSRFVNIIYLLAEGSGKEPYAKDIGQWRKLRRIPAMKLYYNHMNTLHLSYAAFENDLPSNNPAYIRARRYLPETGKGLEGTGLLPEYQNPGLFETGVIHHITIIKHRNLLAMRVCIGQEERYFFFSAETFPPVVSGRIGLRQMCTRSSCYSNFGVFERD
ncbi:MAG: hypothetical protein AB7D05_09270 [Mangrovibacterium sp.]